MPSVIALYCHKCIEKETKDTMNIVVPMVSYKETWDNQYCPLIEISLSIAANNPWCGEDTCGINKPSIIWICKQQERWKSTGDISVSNSLEGRNSVRQKLFPPSNKVEIDNNNNLETATLVIDEGIQTRARNS